jgi:hypothetical protein
MKANSYILPAIPLRLIIAAFSVLLMGCTIQVHTTINSDGSGIYSTVIGFTEEEKSSLESVDTNMQKMCDDSHSSAEASYPGKTVTSKVEDHNGMTQCVVDVAFSNLDELRQIYEQEGQITVNQLQFEDQRLIYDITFIGDSSNEDSSSPFGELGGLVAGVIDASWQVEVPGTVGDNNADRVENNLLIWNLEALTKDKNIYVESKTGGLSLPIVATVALLLLCIIGAGIGTIGGFVLWRMRSRKNQDASVLNPCP